MKLKISNMASKEELMDFTKVPFKHPELYQKSYKITGKEETIIPVITQENTSEISFAIWGLLPENYNEDWLEFQDVVDTLTIRFDELKDNQIIKVINNTKRCLVLVTGFFTSYLKDGKTHQYYISNKHNKPFYVAGYYNKLNDGFLTFTLLLKYQDDKIKKHQNLTQYMPTIINSEDKNLWLSDDLTLGDLEVFFNKVNTLDLNINEVKNSLKTY